jgi:hypothetical protein
MDKTERYRLLSEVVKTIESQQGVSKALEEYAWIHINEILTEQKTKKNLGRLIVWVRKKTSSLTRPWVPPEVLKEAALRMDKDIAEWKLIKQEIFKIEHGWFAGDSDDLDKITDFYSSHRLSPK